MAKLTLQLDDNLHQKLRWLSFKENKSQHAILIAAVKELLKDVKVPKEASE